MHRNIWLTLAALLLIPLAGLYATAASAPQPAIPATPQIQAQRLAPQLAPGKIFTIEFSDMPPTMANLLDHSNTAQPSMTIFLPTNYTASIKYPLLIYLNGGSGGNGKNPGVARKLSEDRDFICVGLPLFKNKAVGNNPTTLGLNDADCRFMWSLYRKMLTRLAQLVPNIDPAHSVLGGFSNGGHATAGLIEQSDGEVLKLFAAFLFVEGGGRLTQFGLLKDRPMLLAYGSKSTRLSRIQEVEQAAKAAGVQIVIHEMKGSGHAFPEGEYPAVRDWLRNVVLKAEVQQGR